MTRQPDMFLPMLAEVRTRQPELFETGGRSSGFVCEVCGCHLEHTASSFLACPRGHGKLMDPETVAWRARARASDQDEQQDDGPLLWPAT